jgi:hypothetical protein
MAVFSSMDSTTAPVGGLQYSSQMSRARSQNAGVSRRVSQPVTLCGFEVQVGKDATGPGR